MHKIFKKFNRNYSHNQYVYGKPHMPIKLGCKCYGKKSKAYTDNVLITHDWPQTVGLSDTIWIIIWGTITPVDYMEYMQNDGNGINNANKPRVMSSEKPSILNPAIINRNEDTIISQSPRHPYVMIA